MGPLMRELLVLCLIALALVAFAIGCTSVTELCPEPTPTPTSAPIEPEPVPALLAPDRVLRFAPFSITLCENYRPNVQVYADSYLLGTMAHHAMTGCMILIVPGLNTAGRRVISAGSHNRVIEVLP
jgi:hypothetical protein